MRSCRAVEIILHIILTGPLQLDGPAGVHGNHGGLGNIVIGEPAPEPATDARHIHTNFFTGQAGHRGSGS